MGTVQEIRGLGGITCVSLWQMILTMLLTYHTCLESMLCAHNYLSVAEFRTILRQEDLIWAAEHSEWPNPHSPLPGGFRATMRMFCLASGKKKTRCYLLLSTFLSWVLLAWDTPDIINRACCDDTVLLYTFLVV